MRAVATFLGIVMLVCLLAGVAAYKQMGLGTIMVFMLSEAMLIYLIVVMFDQPEKGRR